MIYFTHLLRDEEMREIVRNTGMGIESIEFSVSENLDKLQETMIAYEKDFPIWNVNPLHFTDRFST